MQEQYAGANEMTQVKERVVHIRFDHSSTQSACGQMKGPASSWPKGNIWVWPEQLQFITCPACKEIAETARAITETSSP